MSREHRSDTRQGIWLTALLLMWERSMKDCRGEAAFEKDKFHLDGKVSLTLALLIKINMAMS